MDLKIFHFIHDLAGKSSFLDHVMIFLSNWGYVAFILIIIGFLLVTSTRLYGMYGFIALVVTLLINRMLKHIINRPRPFMTHDITILIDKAPSPSFPSDQAAIAGVFLAVCWLLGRRIRYITTILALLVGISRVYVGHHYPTDILAGLTVGIVLFTLVYKLGSKWITRKQTNSISTHTNIKT